MKGVSPNEPLVKMVKRAERREMIQKEARSKVRHSFQPMLEPKMHEMTRMVFKQLK